MKLRLPYALTAALALCWGAAHAELTQTNVLPSLTNGNASAITWMSQTAASGWTDNKWSVIEEITADDLKRALTCRTELTNQGWHSFVGAGYSSGLGGDIKNVTSTGFGLTGRGAHGGEAVMATLDLSSITKPEGATELTSLNISFDLNTHNDSNFFFSVWSWDGTTATLLESDKLATGVTTGNSYKIDLTDVAPTSQVYVLWRDGGYGTPDTVSNLSSTATFNGVMAWTGAGDATWGGAGNWNGNIGKNDGVSFGAIEGDKTVTVSNDVEVRSMSITDDYTFTGEGLIAVAETLTVNNADVTIGSSLAIKADTISVAGDSKLTVEGAVGTDSVTIAAKGNTNETAPLLSGDGEGGASVSEGATIEHATVSATGIAKEDGHEGHGTIADAKVILGSGTDLTVSGVEFDNSIVSMEDGAFVSMNDVVIGAGSAVVNDSGNTYTADNLKVVLTAADVTGDNVFFNKEDGTVTLTSNKLGENATLGGTFDLTLEDGFLKALQLEVVPEYSGTLIIDFGSTVSMASITPGTLDIPEYADAVTMEKAANGVVLSFVDNDKAIPEPATAALSLLALAGLAARRRRK